MPQYEVFNVADKASPVAATRAAALQAEMASISYPPQSDRRNVYRLACSTVAATPKELGVDNVANWRLRLPKVGAFLVRVEWSFLSNTVIGNSAGGTTRVCGYVVAGTATLQPLAANKFPTAATATFVITASGQDLIMTATGNAGDTVGYWTATAYVVDVTDLGA
jgi:hypothetical protein